MYLRLQLAGIDACVRDNRTPWPPARKQAAHVLICMMPDVTFYMPLHGPWVAGISNRLVALTL